MKDYKLLDIDRKGNAIRFYLGKKGITEWYGDDWDDRGENCTVSNRFIEKVVDKTIDFEHSVYSPFDFYEMEDKITKDMMKNGTIPLFIICYNTDKIGDETYKNFYDWYSTLDWKDKKVFHMGDLINEEQIACL